MWLNQGLFPLEHELSGYLAALNISECTVGLESMLIENFTKIVKGKCMHFCVCGFN